MLNNIGAVIFDLDGTLIDSMGIWNQIDIDYLKKHGFEKPKKLQEDICHLTFEETAKYFQSTFNIKDSVEKIMLDWHDMAFHSYCTNTPLKPGVKEFLELLHDLGIKIGLATSNTVSLLEASLKSNNIYHLFDAITTTSEVSRNKDFPDVYLLAAEKLSTSPQHCLVFEDLPVAICGAQKGGMKVVGVYDKWNMDLWSKIQEIANYTIKDYTELLSNLNINRLL